MIRMAFQQNASLANNAKIKIIVSFNNQIQSEIAVIAFLT